MSAEVVKGPRGLFVVIGTPDLGYDVRSDSARLAAKN